MIDLSVPVTKASAALVLATPARAPIFLASGNTAAARCHAPTPWLLERVCCRGSSPLRSRFPFARSFIVGDILNLHSVPVHVLFQRTSTAKSPANSSTRPVLIRLTAYVDLPQRLTCRDGDSLSACGLGLELAAGALSSLKGFRRKLCGTPVASKALDVKAISRSQVFQWLSRLAISPKPILLAGEQQRDTDSLLRHPVFKRREDQQVGSRHGRFPQESACGPTGEVLPGHQ